MKQYCRCGSTRLQGKSLKAWKGKVSKTGIVTGAAWHNLVRSQEGENRGGEKATVFSTAVPL